MQHDPRQEKNMMGITESMKLLKILLSATVHGLLFTNSTEGESLSKSFSGGCYVSASHETVNKHTSGHARGVVGTSKRRQAVQACRQLKASIKVALVMKPSCSLGLKMSFCEDLEYKFADVHGHPPCSVAGVFSSCQTTIRGRVRHHVLVWYRKAAGRSSRFSPKISQMQTADSRCRL